MIFDFVEVKCIFNLLKILNLKESRYSEMFKKIRVSHTTLQSTLKDLIQKEMVVRYNLGHQNVKYQITPKGIKLLKILLQLKGLVT